MSGTPTLGDGSWAAMRRAVRLGDSARRSVLTRIVPEAVTVIKSEKSVSLPLSYALVILAPSVEHEGSRRERFQRAGHSVRPGCRRVALFTCARGLSIRKSLTK